MGRESKHGMHLSKGIWGGTGKTWGESGTQWIWIHVSIIVKLHYRSLIPPKNFTKMKSPFLNGHWVLQILRFLGISILFAWREKDNLECVTLIFPGCHLNLWLHAMHAVCRSQCHQDEWMLHGHLLPYLESCLANAEQSNQMLVGEGLWTRVVVVSLQALL